MVLNYQRWTPLECNCSFQQEVNSDTGEVKLLFAYNICDKHKPIATKQKSKTTLVAKDFTDMKSDSMQRIQKSLRYNRLKNLSDLKNQSLKPRIEDDLTRHESEVSNTVEEALSDPHALSCGDVYNEVVKVMQEENKKRIEKGG